MASASGVGLLSIRPGWTDSGVDGPAPGAGTCRARPGPDGSTLPDPACTPGAMDPATPTLVTTDTLVGLASADRNPPPSVRSAAQAVVFAAYSIGARQRSSYVLDTLIPVALGGSWAYGNLWPVPVPHQFAPNRSLRDPKDVVAAYLHDAVVRHRVKLPAVERALAADWATAVASLRLPPIPTSFACGG